MLHLEKIHRINLFKFHMIRNILFLLCEVTENYEHCILQITWFLCIYSRMTLEVKWYHVGNKI